MLYEIKDRFVYHDENPKNGLLLSLYQTTHRQYPMKKQDLMVYKNLLKEFEVALEHKMDRKSLELKMSAFYALEKDTDFWSSTKEGLAILANEDQCMIIGKIDLITKSILMCDEHPVCDDILDDLAEWVLKFKGKVWILPKEQMPDGSGIAAIYRYD